MTRVNHRWYEGHGEGHGDRTFDPRLGQVPVPTTPAPKLLRKQMPPQKIWSKVTQKSRKSQKGLRVASYIP